MSEKLNNLREENPQYADMDDDTLADKVYSKFYSDMPRKEYEVKLGRDPISKRFAESPTPGVSSFVDYAVNPFGVKDEIDWAGGYVRGLVESDFDTDKAMEEANEAMEWRRAYDKAKGEELGIVPRLVGDIGTIATNPAAAIPGFATRVGQGAGLGAVYGAGESEGGVEERLAGATTGAAIGGGVGLGIEAVRPAASAIAKYGGKAGRAVRDVAGDVVPGAKRNTDSRIRRALEHQQMTPEEALSSYEAGQVATKLGGARTDLPESIVDLGTGTQRLGMAVHTRPGRGAAIAEEKLQSRAKTQFGRIRDQLAQSLRIKRQDYFKKRANLVDEQKALSKPAYDTAFANSQPVPLSNTLMKWEMNATQEAGKLRDSLEKAIGLFRNKYARGRARGRENLVTLKQVDAAKRALDDQVEEAMRAGRNAEARLLTQFKRDVVDQADRASTVATSEGPKSLYAEARKVYSSRAEMIDALEEGRKAFRGDVEVNKDIYKGMTPAEKRMFRVGVAQEVKKKLGAKQFGHDMASFFNTPNRRELFETVMGRRSKSLANFDELMQREQQFIDSRNLITRGSQTEVRKEAVQDFNIMMQLGREFSQSGVLGAAANFIGQGLMRLTRMSEQDAYRVAQVLFEQDPNEVRKVLNRLVNKYGAKKVRQASRTAIQQAIQFRTGAGAAASIGGQTGEVEAGRLPAPAR